MRWRASTPAVELVCRAHVAGSIAVASIVAPDVVGYRNVVPGRLRRCGLLGRLIDHLRFREGLGALQPLPQIVQPCVEPIYLFSQRQGYCDFPLQTVELLLLGVEGRVAGRPVQQIGHLVVGLLELRAGVLRLRAAAPQTAEHTSAGWHGRRVAPTARTRFCRRMVRSRTARRPAGRKRASGALISHGGYLQNPRGSPFGNHGGALGAKPVHPKRTISVSGQAALTGGRWHLGHLGHLGQFGAAPVQQLRQAQRDPPRLDRRHAGARGAQAGVDAAEDLRLRGCLHVVERLRLLHEVVGEVLAQFVAFAYVGRGCGQALARVAVERGEGGRDEDLVVVVHGQQCGAGRPWFSRG